MASTFYVDYQKPAIGAAWLNDVNNFVYNSISDTASVKYYGAKGDGVTDDTAAIQRAFNIAKNVYFPPGDYIVDAVDPNYPTTMYGGGIKPQSNSIIRFMAGARLLVKSNASALTTYVVFNLRNTSNVTIYDATIFGDVDTHSGITGEWGMGYYLASATNPRLFNCQASKCWGDGFYVGNSIETTNTPCVGGAIVNAVADDNRRQGMSIVSWNKGLVLGGEFKNTGLTKFTQPAYGIDIEPDAGGLDSVDVMLVGIRTSGNKFGGLQIVPGFMSAAAYTNPKYNVTVIGMDSEQDNGQGALRFAYPNLAAPIVVANKVYGSIRLNNIRIVESAGRGVDFARWVPTAPEVIIDTIDVIDCNTSGSVATIEDQSGIVMNMTVADVAQQTGHGKVTIINPRIVDTRAIPKMLLPIEMSNGSGTQSYSGIEIRNASGSGWSSTSNSFVRVPNASGVSVNFSNPPTQDYSGSIGFTNGAYAGYSIALSVSGVLTIPPANTSIGLTYTFENRFSTTMQIRPDPADTIIFYGRTVGNDVVLSDKGDNITLKSIGGNTWEATSNTGRARPLGFLRPPTIVYTNTVPSTGTWLVGDRAVNIASAVGVARGWTRVTTGSGNTLGVDWISEGNL